MGAWFTGRNETPQRGFRDHFGADADAQIAARTETAHAGIPVTLAAIKATAEAGRR